MYNRGTLSPLCREHTLSLLYREGVCPPQHRAEGHSILGVENTLSPLYREGVCHPLCREEENNLLYRKKEYVILSIGKRYTLSFATRRSLSPPFVEERHCLLYV